MLTDPNSGNPIPRSQRPKAMSSRPSSVKSQCIGHGSEELDDGIEVDVGEPLSMRST